MRTDIPINRRRMPYMAESSRLLPARESSSAYHNYRHIGNGVHQNSSQRNNLSQFLSLLKGNGFNSNKNFHPFKIYQVPRAFCSIDGGILPGNAWRTFSVRDGIVSYRSKYGANGNQPIITAGSPRTQGNFDNNFPVLGTDGVVDWLGTQNSDYQAQAYAALPFSFPVQLDADNETGPQGLPTQFVLTDAPNANGGWLGAGFYIKIVDNPGGNNTSVYLAARMFDVTTGPFPDPDPMIIPLGVVYPVGTGTIYDPAIIATQFFILQVQYDHLTNRYPAFPGPDGFQNALNYRGDWDDDTLADQYFWPGDVVTVAETSTAGGLTLTSTSAYIHSGASVENTPPPGANWKSLSVNTLT